LGRCGFWISEGDFGLDCEYFGLGWELCISIGDFGLRVGILDLRWGFWRKKRCQIPIEAGSSLLVSFKRGLEHFL
jgi:hypothetical protein